ncbi:hypothetical protein [Streptomyces sp. NRRL F-5123]|uniref:hypothetical protein n=1 Tax=Streptomyces sp. NRRL F-5123 TaxID=1463856 RepID=UPI0004E1F4D9|nr:hypothetical protein [Streptomyces sp. NRRL F-5123]
MERRRRTAPRRALLLACAAAVPALLLAGCSSGGSGSDSGSGSGGKGSGNGKGKDATASASATTAAPAPEKFATLPNACLSVGQATVTAIVPKAKSPAGTPATSDDAKDRAGCSWTGNGKDGYQYRWLSVTLQRFASTPASPAEDQAKERFTGQAADLGSTTGAKASAVTGVGDQAFSFAGKATVAKVTSQDDTLLVRTGNVVVIVEYNGAGLEGKKNPSASTVDAGALRAAKEAVAAVAAANA